MGRSGQGVGTVQMSCKCTGGSMGKGSFLAGKEVRGNCLVWMNEVYIETMSIDDLYNNFKIVEQDVKKSAGASTGAQNMAFMTTPSTSSTNDINNANPAYEASTFSPNQDLEQIHKDDLEAMDLRVQRKQDGRFRSQDNTKKQRSNEDTSSKVMLAIDGVGFDWSDMAEEPV
uniref:Uncharacterized protein n=1 Tax=Tanacetum cinerariifolium TaxID=118510 RepID=A0A6L2NP15_TANCI|nr:hypothetical protein [Tanacetum cinerariifolium]